MSRLPPGVCPVCVMYDAVSWPFTPCVMLRMIEYLSACVASIGISCPTLTPSTFVGSALVSGPQ
jgi:hypothetical protein